MKGYTGNVLFVDLTHKKTRVDKLNQEYVRLYIGGRGLGARYLFDYLEPRLFCKLVNRCHEHLKHGGSLLIGNFAPHKDMLFMDHLLHWKLIYRTREELRELFKDTHFGGDVTILAEPEKVNLFVLAHKN